MDDQRTDRECGVKRFSIRDLLWLMVVVAILVMWSATNRRQPLHPMQVVDFHNTRDEVLMHDTVSYQYYVYGIKHIETLPENEAYKWDRTK
jgi:hypothetical protein